MYKESFSEPFSCPTASDDGDVSTSAPVYRGPLGADLQKDRTTFTVWSPDAEQIELRLYHSGDPDDEPYGTEFLKPLNDGAWGLTLPQALPGVYYDYLVTMTSGSVNQTIDPWGKASGVNAGRSMVVDLSSTNPQGWGDDRSPEIPLSQTVIWETHVADFSSDPNGGFPKGHRGRYKAFADDNTSLVDSGAKEESSVEEGAAPECGRSAVVDAEAGTFPTGIAYLKTLGVTHVQIMPFFDFGSVDESSGTSYNWGYDPIAYDLPDGAYSDNPHDGARRIRECKEMIASLHRNGFRVIMDVVYNHMYTADNSFERMAPGYFCRRDADGNLTDASGCGDDMASEQPMFSRFIVDSLVYWASEYHVDGFRFDLMGLIDVGTLNAARKALDALPGGSSIIMFGEPWADRPERIRTNAILAGGEGLKKLDQRIGWFCSKTRDAISGNVRLGRDGGFVNGRAAELSDRVASLQDGWRHSDLPVTQVGQLIQYVSTHDDLTLWDKLCMSLRAQPSHDDYLALEDVADLLAANAVAAGLVLTAAGVPFMLSGEEFARTKFGCNNSFNKSVTMNQLDWSRAKRMLPLVNWYRTLISIRRSHPTLFDGVRKHWETPQGVVAVEVGDLLIGANPETSSIRLSPPANCAAGRWEVLADSQWVLDARALQQDTDKSGDRPAPDKGLSGACDADHSDCSVMLPGRTFRIWVHKL